MAVLEKLWNELSTNELAYDKLYHYLKFDKLASWRNTIDLLRQNTEIIHETGSVKNLKKALYTNPYFVETATESELRQMFYLVYGRYPKRKPTIVPSQPFIYNDTIERVETEDGGRFYRNVKNGDTFSWRGVTSIYSAVHPFDKRIWIRSIQKKNPDWEMDQIVQYMEDVKNNAAKRGTAMHEAIEQYLMDPSYDWENECDECGIPYFKCMLSLLRYQIDEVIAVEPLVYWDMSEIAGEGAGAIGYIDCIGRHNGETILYDWKTSDKPKNREYLNNYFVQVSAYSAMVYQMYGIKIDEARICVAIKGRTAPQVFTLDRMDIKNYLRQFIINVKKYMELMRDQDD